MNGLIFIAWALVGISMLLGVYKLFGKYGLYAMIAGSVVLMNILVTKSVTIFGIGATGGNVLYAMIFLATDILNENHGPKEARRAVLTGFSVGAFAFVASMVGLVMAPAPWDFAHSHLMAIMSPMFRIVAGSWLAYLISQNQDVLVFDWVKRKGGKLWMSNNFSTWTSQLSDTLVFCTVALLGTMPFNAWVQIVISTYILKVLVAAIDTPFLYIAKKINPIGANIASG